MPDESAPILEQSANPHSIIRISVDKLFGQFTYELPPKNGNNLGPSNLFILYGDNGSGKTTILNLLFHLLSPEDGRGHKSAVAKIRFRRFAVELANGTTIEALRPSSLDGMYRAAILKGSETIDSIDFPASGKSGDQVGDEVQLHVRSFLRKLRDFGLALHFLPDNRRIQGREAEVEEFERRRRRLISSSGQIFLPTTSDEEDSPGATLKSAVNRAATWIRQQALSGSNRGQRGVHSLYMDITKHIVESSQSQISPDDEHGVDELIDDLRSLSQRSEAYSQFGLTSELPIAEIVSSIRQANPETKPILYHVMRPYVQSTKARLDALASIHTLVKTFMGNVNAFLGNTKQVSYDVRHGFTIASKFNEALDLEMLSSGERQLLLLMCNTLAARDQASILIIDEPEISLNVKWQRRLVQSLLDCIEGSNAQLVFATHSIELLAKHRRQVMKLIDLNNSEETSNSEGKRDATGGEADNRRVDGEV